MTAGLNEALLQLLSVCVIVALFYGAHQLIASYRDRDATPLGP